MMTIVYKYGQSSIHSPLVGIAFFSVFLIRKFSYFDSKWYKYVCVIVKWYVPPHP